MSRWQVDLPVVGIMTMPVYNENMRTSNF